jgi:hypothetical protein
MWLRPAHTVPRDFQACVVAGIFSSEKCARLENFRVKKIFAHGARRTSREVFRGKTDVRGIFPEKNQPVETAPALSTIKVTENFHFPPLICLTGLGPVSISCGQGSGHPHPVVVDNVSGSFGNFRSPRSFCRL